MFTPLVLPLPVREHDSVRVLTLEPGPLSAQLLRAPTQAHQGGGVVVASDAVVTLGERVDVHMQARGSGRLAASGVVRAVVSRGPDKPPWIHVLIVRTHAHRVNRMIELCAMPRESMVPPRSSGSEPTILRVLGDQSLLDSIRPPERGLPGGAIELAWQGPRKVGDEICVEVSLGAMADPIELSGCVRRLKAGSHGSSVAAQIEILAPHALRLAYVADVLKGQRAPTARAHPRFNLDLRGRWWMGARVESQSFGDLSCGGTFVATRTERSPSVGSVVPMELVDRFGVPLRLESEVVWLSGDPERPGFGARFNIARRELRDRLADLLEREGTPASAWA